MTDQTPDPFRNEDEEDIMPDPMKTPVPPILDHAAGPQHHLGAILPDIPSADEPPKSLMQIYDELASDALYLARRLASLRDQLQPAEGWADDPTKTPKPVAHTQSPDSEAAK